MIILEEKDNLAYEKKELNDFLLSLFFKQIRLDWVKSLRKLFLLNSILLDSLIGIVGGPLEITPIQDRFISFMPFLNIAIIVVINCYTKSKTDAKL